MQQVERRIVCFYFEERVGAKLPHEHKSETVRVVQGKVRGTLHEICALGFLCHKGLETFTKILYIKGDQALQILDKVERKCVLVNIV